jgi:hypothetical protein
MRSTFATRRLHLMIAAWCLPLVVPTLAHAEELDLKKIPQKKVCERVAGPGATSRVNPDRFSYWLFDEFKIGRSCERDSGGAIRLMASTDMVSSEQCSEKEKDAIYEAREYVGFLLRDTRQDNFRVETALTGRLKAADLFSTPPRAQVFCLRVEPAGQKSVPELPKLSETKIGGWQLKLRGDQDSLKYKSSDPDYKTKAKSASLSITDDALKGSSSYSTNITLGLDSGKIEDLPRSSLYQFIPYVKWDKTHFEPLKKGSELEKVAFGALGVWYYLPDNAFINSKLSFDPQWVTDEVGNTGLFGMTIKYDPTFIWRYDGKVDTFPGPRRDFAGLFNYQWDVLGVVRAGYVFDDGGNPSLSLTKNFVYYGPQVGLTISGLEDTGWENLKLNLSYFNLTRGEGPFAHVEKFTGALTYMFTKDGNVDVTLSYESGREYEKFEKAELWKTSFGYKF